MLLDLTWPTETVQKDPSDDLVEFFKNPAFWSSLHHAGQCSFVDLESFGFGQPNVRKAAWTLVQTLLRTWKGRFFLLFTHPTY